MAASNSEDFGIKRHQHHQEEASSMTGYNRSDSVWSGSLARVDAM